MKNFLFISMVALSVLVSGGCKKKNADPCEGKTCLNGGACNDGTCSCPLGYTGEDCGTQITPTKITITGVRVTKFSALNGNDKWDKLLPLPADKNADIYAVIKTVVGGTEIYKTSTIDEADQQTYTFPNPQQRDVTNLIQDYNIELLDEDSGLEQGDDSMGNFNFKIYTETNKFPTKLVVANTAGTLEFELSLSYTY